VVCLVALAVSRQAMPGGADSARPAADIAPSARPAAVVTATAAGPGVAVVWQIDADFEPSGFRVWRSPRANGDYARLNAALIPARAGRPNDSRYIYVDPAVEPGRTYYYRLEIAGLDGQVRWAGPVPASVDPFDDWTELAKRRI
jgi:hypothetical protein